MIDRKSLIEDYQQVAQELDKRPTLAEYQEHGEYSSQPIYDRFDSFEALKEAAGFKTGQQRVGDETLLQDVQRVAEKVGRSPPIQVYREHGNHSGNTLKRRFGNWNKTLKAAGLEPTDHSEHWEDTERDDWRTHQKHVETTCDYCGETFQKRQDEAERTDRDFCDHECMGNFMSELTEEDARAWKGKEEISCETCGETRKVVPALADSARFCSQECMLKWRNEYLSGKNNPRWKESPRYRYYGLSWPEQSSKALERDNHTCQLCGRSNEESLQKWDERLTVHHIKRFYDFAAHDVANELPNLLSVCKTCHSRLENKSATIPQEVSERQQEWLTDVPTELYD